MATTRRLPPTDLVPEPGSEPRGARTPEAGEWIGKCRVLERIATGGMAIVYKVMHEELEVVRAVKLLKPDSSPEWRSRLKTEAKISANLHHPNIVQIYNVDVWHGGLPFIEMEYIAGRSLDEIVSERGHLSLPFALAIAAVVCRALHFAQGSSFRLYGKVYTGLVHRDIKPANILLSSAGVVKLADFGIAQPGSVSLHTVGSHILGTYAYLSPEQLDGFTLDRRSDTYSLGAVLYEMVTGVKAFPQRSVGELVQAKLKGSYKTARSLVPDLPEELERVLGKAMALKREDRYSSSAEFGSALERLLVTLSDRRPEEVVADMVCERPSLVSIPTVSRGRRKAGMWWVAGAVVGAALVATGVAVSRGTLVGPEHRSREAKAAAAAPAPQAHRPPSRDTIAPPVSPAIAPAVSRREPSRVTPHPESPVKPLSGPGQEDGRRTLAGGGRTVVVDPRAADSLLARKLEEYLREGNLEKATPLIKDDNTDGYLDLLAGQVHHRSGDHDKADAAFARAQTTPSSLRKDVRQDAVYWWAVNRTEMYRKKPNAENRSLALRAWRSYADAFCRGGGSTERCAAAREPASTLLR